MCKLKLQQDRNSLHVIYMYMLFIRPLLEYADVVWDNCAQYEINELEKIQNNAARIATGASKLVPIENVLLLNETGWSSRNYSVLHDAKRCMPPLSHLL